MTPASEIVIRLASFAAIFAGMALWELWSACRALLFGRKPRWPSNPGIVIVDAVAVRLLIPVAAIGMAIIAAEKGWGLFHEVTLPYWLAAIAGFLVLDFAIYVQHYLFHHVPLLWRSHRMHHADLDIDLTTGLRFHPIEILISMAIKIAFGPAFGIPALSVLVFEIALNATSMFNHASVAMPGWLDRIARLLMVVPDMHRMHHSIMRAGTDSNFRFNLPRRNCLFGTYRAQPMAGYKGMTIGIPLFRDPRELRLDCLLTQPFRDDIKADAMSPQR